MGKIKILAVVALLSVGAYFLFTTFHFNEMFGKYIENGEFLTLEAKYSAEQIMDSHRKDLLGENQRSYQNNDLRFYPYLLMEVKYTQADKKPREGVVLWGMVDGEMVLNTDSWEKTHGFEDTLIAQATRNDFRVLNALSKNSSGLSESEISKELHLEPETVRPWIHSAVDKHLISQNGSKYQLHLQNPKISVQPQTKITQHLVSKPYMHAQKVSSKYSPSQIETLAKAAFGSDFTIRRSFEIFLPVYSIEVLNQDGSVLTSYWNALNGERIVPKYMSQTP
jgi:hypothetical protein